MSELLPCPFCGGKNQWIEDIDTMLGIRWYVFCPKCGAQGGRSRTQVEAVNMWNMRATLGNGTCEMETDHDELELIASSHEDTWGYRCSACGWVFRYDRGIKPDYCPNCGRKVVSE